MNLYKTQYHSLSLQNIHIVIEQNPLNSLTELFAKKNELILKHLLD